MTVYRNPLNLRQEFIPAERLRLEVAQPAYQDFGFGPVTNLNPNPTPVLGAWGYTTPTGVIDLAGVDGRVGIRLTNPSQFQTSVYLSTYWAPVQPDPGGAAYVAVRYDCLDLVGGTDEVLVQFWTADRSSNGGSSFQVPASPDGVTRYGPAVQVPPGTAWVTARVALFGAAIGSSVTIDRLMIAWGDNAQALQPSAYGFVGGADWVNILNHTTEVTISRATLDASTLKATTLDPDLDPSRTAEDALRVGQAVRVVALADFPDGERWEPLYTGTIDDVVVTYELDKATGATKPRIAIEATDAAQTLANTPGRDGFDQLAGLTQWLLPSTNIPYLVNYTAYPHKSNQIAPVAHNDDASVLDQLVIARDVVQGYAWVDRHGRLQAWDPGYGPLDFALLRAGTWTITGGTRLAGSNGEEGSILGTSAGGFSMTRNLPVEEGRTYYIEVALEASNGGAYDTSVVVEWLGIDSSTVIHTEGSWQADSTEGGSPIVLEGMAPKGAYAAKVSVYVWDSPSGITHTYGVAFRHVPTLYTSRGIDTYGDNASTFTTLDVSFATHACINVVKVQWNRYDAAEDNTQQIAYGPYVDQPSIDEHGPYSATFVLQGGAESEDDIEAFAAQVLARNAWPERTANAMAVEVLTPKDVRLAILNDLCSPIQATYYDREADDYLVDHKAARITGITHQITPAGWTVDYAFDPVDSVAAPQETPAPSASVVPAPKFIGRAGSFDHAPASPGYWVVAPGGTVTLANLTVAVPPGSNYAVIVAGMHSGRATANAAGNLYLNAAINSGTPEAIDRARTHNVQDAAVTLGGTVYGVIDVRQATTLRYTLTFTSDAGSSSNIWIRPFSSRVNFMA